MTHEDLLAYMNLHSVQGWLLDIEAAIDAPGVVKSLVFTARGRALLVVLAGADKVDERKLAAHLQVPRRRLALASPQHALEASGYAVGTIPPLGLRTPLRTILDISVTRHDLVISGSGHPQRVLEVAVPELLRVTSAEVADVAVREAAPADMAAAACGGGSGTPGALLPLPWPAGSRAVQLIGVVAQRRRIAKLLQFTTLIPEVGLPDISSTQAAYMRRLWRSPDSGQAVELQLIMGKTLERNLGREAALQLLERCKVGSIVSVMGMVQPHTAREGSSAVGRTDVLDVVVHRAQVLFRNRDVLQRALVRARRSAGVNVGSARELMLLQQMGADAYRGSYAGLPGGGSSSSGSEGGGSGSETDDGIDEELEGSWGAGAGSDPGRSGGLGPEGQLAHGEVCGAGDAAMQGASDGRYWELGLAPEAIITVDDIAGVQRMRQALQAGLLTSSGSSSSSSNTNSNSGGSSNGPGAHAGDGSGSSGSRASTSAEHMADGGTGLQPAPALVVGLDTEWVPFERGQAKTPVALLQVALRDRVFLVDLLAICSPAGAISSSEGGSSDSRSDDSGAFAGAGSGAGGGTPGSSRSSGSTGSSSGSGSGRRELPLPPGSGPSQATATGMALGEVLREVMASPDIIKCGFQLSTDLARLQESYPWMPCFQPLPPEQQQQRSTAGVSGRQPRKGGGDGGELRGQPLRMHVDMLLLARALQPRLALQLPRASLSQLVGVLLGGPLDKAQQRSNWAARPLNGAQRAYAAADAAALVALYDELVRGSRLPVHRKLLETLGNGLGALPVTAPADGAECS